MKIFRYSIVLILGASIGALVFNYSDKLFYSLLLFSIGVYIVLKTEYDIARDQKAKIRKEQYQQQLLKSQQEIEQLEEYRNSKYTEQWLENIWK